MRDRLEYCCQCGDATGHAGMGEDSLYTDRWPLYGRDGEPVVTGIELDLWNAVTYRREGE